MAPVAHFWNMTPSKFYHLPLRDRRPMFDLYQEHVKQMRAISEPRD